MTTIILVSGEKLKVRGTLTQVIESYNSKENTQVLPSRINDNLTIFINGRNIGEIQH
tara:strand:+ start:833 stop:1003 length:171 start_codon:yes stop_codon:yes gene_type:complete